MARDPVGHRMKALFKALLRLYQGSVKALLREQMARDPVGHRMKALFKALSRLC